MNIIVRNIFLSILVSMCVTACYDDKGNYDYTSVEDISVTLPASLQAMTNGDRVYFTPSVVSAVTGREIDANDDKFTYECKLSYRHSVDGVEYDWYDINPLQTKTVDYLTDIPTGEYTLWYIVHNNETGVSYSATTRLRIMSSTYEGWIVLSNDNGYARLDMVYLDPANEFHTATVIRPDGNTPVRNGTQLYFKPNTGVGGIPYILAQQDACYLDYKTLEFNPNFVLRNTEFIFPSASGELVSLVGVQCYGSEPLAYVGVSAEGNAYANVGHNSRYLKPMNTDSQGNAPTYRVSAMIATGKSRPGSSPSVLLFDETNRRFMGWYAYADDTQLLFPLEDNDEDDLFSFSTPDKELVHMEGTRKSGGLAYSVLQDINDGRRSIYGINTDGWGTFDKEAFYTGISAEDWDVADKYAFHSQYPIVSYSKGSKVYCYNLETGVTTDIIELDNETVTMMKYNFFETVYPYWLSRYEDEDFMRNEYRLIVCSSDGSPDSGVIRMYDISSEGKMTLYREFRGLGNDIVDVVYREHNQYEF